MTRKKKTAIHVPRDILARIALGQTFAEYDRILLQPGIFVKTPAVVAAEDDSRAKCFFVGRRGTGKTAIARYLANRRSLVVEIHPEIFATVGGILDPGKLSDTRQPPVRALIASLKRAFLDEVFKRHVADRRLDFDDLTKEFKSERNFIEDHDFDTRVYSFISESFSALENHDQKNYLKQINRAKNLGHHFDRIASGLPTSYLLIDRLDDSWDGSDRAVILLMAMLHACLELATTSTLCRPLLFVRENVLERVRRIDTEYTRLEACVVSLDWTEEQLVEMIERRLQYPMNPKPPLGETWDYLFERLGDVSSRQMALAFCQKRPRDLIRFCATAIEAAVAKRHQVVTLDDLALARRQFSVGSLKDLADEYSENYPQIQLILSRFHGLAPEFTIAAIGMFVKKLLVDPEVSTLCKEWIYKFTAPTLFIEMMWSIGFFGIKNESVEYRGFGAIASTTPPIGSSSHVIIHPSFHDALDLQAGRVIGELDEDKALQTHGLLVDLPASLDLTEYVNRVKELSTSLERCPMGHEGQNEFERIVGETIRLCFFRSLGNVQSRERSYDSRVIRDWIGSNIAETGFWEMVRNQHGATQVIWECKNYENLKADDFHQCAYYMNDKIGRFMVLCYRGTREGIDNYYPHLRRIADEKKGIVLLLTEQDIKVFLRQASRGKTKEDHIRERYDSIIRAIS